MQLCSISGDSASSGRPVDCFLFILMLISKNFRITIHAKFLIHIYGLLSFQHHVLYPWIIYKAILLPHSVMEARKCRWFSIACPVLSVLE